MMPKRVHKNTPFTKMFLPLTTSFSVSAEAISGVIAVEKPTPTEIAINTKLLANDAAANSVAPIFPTIMLSTRSEERRVGKECRYRCWPYGYKKESTDEHYRSVTHIVVTTSRQTT